MGKQANCCLLDPLANAVMVMVLIVPGTASALCSPLERHLPRTQAPTPSRKQEKHVLVCWLDTRRICPSVHMSGSSGALLCTEGSISVSERKDEPGEKFIYRP